MNKLHTKKRGSEQYLEVAPLITDLYIQVAYSQSHE